MGIGQQYNRVSCIWGPHVKCVALERGGVGGRQSATTISASSTSANDLICMTYWPSKKASIHACIHTHMHTYIRTIATPDVIVTDNTNMYKV